MNREFVVLRGIGYEATFADDQVIFTEQIPISHRTVFTLERPRALGAPGIWYLTSLDMGIHGMPVGHIIAAVEWCKERFGKSHEPYKAEMATQ